MISQNRATSSLHTMSLSLFASATLKAGVPSHLTSVISPIVSCHTNDRHCHEATTFFIFLNLLGKAKSSFKFVIYHPHSQAILLPFANHAESGTTFSRWGSLSAQCLGNSRRQRLPVNSNLLLGGFLSKGTTWG